MRYTFRFTSVFSLINISRAVFLSLIASLQLSEKYGLLKRFGTADVLGIVSSAMSLRMEVNNEIISTIHGRSVKTSAA